MVVHLVGVLKAGPFCWPDREKKEVDSEYWDQDQNLAVPQLEFFIFGLISTPFENFIANIGKEKSV